MASILTLEEAEAYLERIELPQAARYWLREGPLGPNALRAVTALQRQHLITVPFENLSQHYSEYHSLPQTTEHTFQTVVTKRRGGVCTQVHQLFVKLLRTFGFAAYNTGCRINAAASLTSDSNLDQTKISYGQWIHLISIVEIGETKYVVDTNNGPRGSPSPVPMVEGEPVADLAERQRRMIYDAMPGWTSTTQKWWRMQFRDSEADLWMDVYAFTDTEWLPVDFEVIRIALEVLEIGWVAARVVCFHVVFEEEEPVGYVMIWGDELRKNYRGKTKVVQKFYTEQDRIEALADEFGIHIDEEEQKQIVGRISEIKDAGFNYYG